MTSRQVIRTTTHNQFSNAGKETLLRAFVRDYRVAAVSIGRIQMRRWNESGAIERNCGSKSQNKLGAAPAQMAAAQVLEAITSHWSNRAGTISAMQLTARVFPPT